MPAECVSGLAQATGGADRTYLPGGSGGQPMKRPARIVLALAVAAMLASAAGGSYVVKWGDTLSTIADRFGTSTSALAGANGIDDPDRIYVGQVLQIPGSDAPSSSLYVVEWGDTLDRIARKVGTSAATIADANGITDPDRIYVGTRLRLTPDPQPFSAQTGTRVEYLIQPGDTLAGIARSTQTTLSRLVDLNGIADPNLIRAGDRLVVEGSWVCPVPEATFFNDWGFPRSGGRFHEGNDLFAPTGTPVRAPVAGTVRQVTGTIGGNQFELSGDDGHLYIGTHLEGFAASGPVLGGEVIGYVGTSGNAAGSRPHLHFEIHAGGETAVNPYPTLSEACS